MPSCPQCNKPLAELSRQCPTCRADLDLLMEYVSGLQGSLVRAEQLTRAGELGQAFWAYMQVLEVDPDNPTARRQVSLIATAVRQFDRTAPGRRWAQGLPAEEDSARSLAKYFKMALLVMLVIVTFSLGFVAAQHWGTDDAGGQPDNKPGPTKPLRDDQMMKQPPGLLK